MLCNIPLCLLDVANLLFQMENKATSARGSDLSKIRYESMEYIPSFGTYQPPPSYPDKTLRGFHNVATGRLLCPQRLLETFDADPDACVLHEQRNQ